MKRKVFGLDLAKSVFHVVDDAGKRKKLRRTQVLPFFARQVCLKIAIESCAGSHYWARALKALGHEVVLLPPQHVKAYLRGQKNDFNDAQALQEAALVGRIRPVPVKSVSQQDQQLLINVRRQVVRDRTRLGNELRAMLYECGIVLRQGIAVVRRQVPELLEEAGNGLSSQTRLIVSRHYARFVGLCDELALYDRELEQQAREDEDCRRLQEVPAFGVVVSSAFKSWVGDGSQFRRGRDASAALGVVPRQHSSGDKPVLLGISKRGDGYLRSLVIHGARAVARVAHRKDDRLSVWVTKLIARRGFNKAVVALANKLVRIAWVVVARGERYQPMLA